MTIDMDLELLNRLVGIVIPILVALLTKKVASGGLRASLNVVLAAVSAALQVAVGYEGKGIPLDVLLDSFATTFVTGIAVYYGLLKPTGITDTITNQTPNFGLGSPPTMETDDVGAAAEGEAIAEAQQE